MFVKLLFFAAIFTTCVASRRQEYCRAKPPPLNNTEIEARLNRGSIELSGKFLYQLLTTSSDNFVLSATSLLVPLAQITYFAIGTVSKQLLRVLNLKSPAEIKSVYPGVISKYENQKEVVFELATKYYFNIYQCLTKNFTRFSLDTFHASGENVDFSNNVAAAKTINSWVQNKTHDKIKDLISSDSLGPSTTLVCVNAIYFLGNWVNQFKEQDTIPRDFYLNDVDKVQIPIMYQEKFFGYYEDSNLKIKALQMPYKGGNFSFLVILPNEKSPDAIKIVAEKLQDPLEFIKIVDNIKQMKVQVYLPKFKINTKLDMAAMLKKDNVTEVFIPGSNGLKGITTEDQSLYISDIVQKAFIEVNEKGTEAAAATAIGIRTLSLPISPPPVQVFMADHPFLFNIVFEKTILFCGAFLRGEAVNN